MTYGIDVVGSEIRWVALSEQETSSQESYQGCGCVSISGESNPLKIKQAIAGLFKRNKIRKFVVPVWGNKVRAKVFASDKVDISELEDNVAWEARFMLDYNSASELLSFDPLRRAEKQTWLACAVAPLDTIKQYLSYFPSAPACVDTALTALANAVTRSRYNQKDVMALHLDANRAFLVVVNPNNPALMQEIPNIKENPGRLNATSLSFWQEELKLRLNLLTQEHRRIELFLLSGELALAPENAVNLGEKLGVQGEVLDIMTDSGIKCSKEQSPLYTLAYASALRGEVL